VTGHPGPRLAQRHHDEDKKGKTAGAGQHEQQRKPEAGGQQGRRDQRPDDLAGTDHQAHQAIAFGPQPGAHKVGDHGVAGREKQRPAQGAVTEHRKTDRPEPVRESEAAVHDPGTAATDDHHGTPPETVAQAAGQRLQRQAGQRRAAHDRAHHGHRDAEALLDEDRRVGKRQADDQQVEERAADE